MAGKPFNPDKAFRHWEMEDDLQETRPAASDSDKGPPDRPMGQRTMLSISSMDICGIDGSVVLSHVAPLWVRVTCARMALLAMNIDLLDRRNVRKVAGTLSLIGIGNVVEFCEQQGVDALPWAVADLLKHWSVELMQERAGGSHIKCPLLRRNLSQLSAMAQLDELDEDLLLFFVLADQDLSMVGLQRKLGDVPILVVQLLLAHGLGVPLESIRSALSSTGRLAITNLLTLDPAVGQASMSCHFDLPSQGFAVAMCRESGPIEQVAVPLATRATEGCLNEDHFEHVREELSWISALLGKVEQGASNHAHVLLYGKPGVGKSELARLIAQRAGRQLIEIHPSDSHRLPCDRRTRLRGYKMAQTFYRDDALFLMDECEDLLAINATITALDAGSQGLSKAWLIDLLESSRSTIWVCNQIEEVDPAILRRFRWCLRVPNTPEKQRHEHIQSQAQDLLSPETVRKLSKHSQLSPAVADSVVQTVAALGDQLDTKQRSTMAVALTNQYLLATGQKEIPTEKDYLLLLNTSYVNSDPGIEALLKGLAGHRDGRLLLYGPPGTGKTLFGKFLAQLMDREAHQHKTSELLSKYVGESEERLSRAFARAKRAGAILHFDEVDSVLSDRQNALQTHEVTLVNTFLEELESHTGIVVATTNRLESIDPAALRRFDVLVKFDYMTQKAVLSMFRHMCSVLRLSRPTKKHLDVIASLDRLTPGDFEQVKRQARFLPLRTTQDFVDRLVKIALSKPRSGSKGMGFLKAA